MSWTALFQKSWRWLFWPALVILALNIENVAAALGWDKLLTTRWPFVTEIATFIRSDTALHIALFVAGGGAFAWGNYIVRKMDEGVPGLHSLGMECENLSEMYSGKKWPIGPRKFAERIVERRTEWLNRRLAKRDIAPVPFPDTSDQASRLHVAQYLQGLSMFLKRKDLQGAQRAERLYLSNLEAVGFVPRPLPETEAEVQPQA